MTIRLYDFVGRDPKRPFSPHCWKVAFALAHKGLEFESVPTTFTEVPAVEGAVSKTVPVIRDGEMVVAESFAIALYLEENYPERPSLFSGEGGQAMARFIERWCQLTIHPFVGAAVLMDIHDCLGPEDQAHFRTAREALFGKRLEQVPARRDAGVAAFRQSLEPLRATLGMQPFLGGQQPLFCDYIVAGAFQWARVVSPFRLLEEGDRVAEWFERCLSLHGGLGARVPAA